MTEIHCLSYPQTMGTKLKQALAALLALSLSPMPGLAQALSNLKIKTLSPTTGATGASTPYIGPAYCAGSNTVLKPDTQIVTLVSDPNSAVLLSPNAIVGLGLPTPSIPVSESTIIEPEALSQQGFTQSYVGQEHAPDLLNEGGDQIQILKVGSQGFQTGLLDFQTGAYRAQRALQVNDTRTAWGIGAENWDNSTHRIGFHPVQFAQHNGVSYAPSAAFQASKLTATIAQAPMPFKAPEEVRPWQRDLISIGVLFGILAVGAFIVARLLRLFTQPRKPQHIPPPPSLGITSTQHVSGAPIFHLSQFIHLAQQADSTLLGQAVEIILPRIISRIDQIMQQGEEKRQLVANFQGLPRLDYKWEGREISATLGVRLMEILIEHMLRHYVSQGYERISAVYNYAPNIVIVILRKKADPNKFFQFSIIHVISSAQSFADWFLQVKSRPDKGDPHLSDINETILGL